MDLSPVLGTVTKSDNKLFVCPSSPSPVPPGPNGLRVCLFVCHNKLFVCPSIPSPLPLVLMAWEWMHIIMTNLICEPHHSYSPTYFFHYHIIHITDTHTYGHHALQTHVCFLKFDNTDFTGGR